MMKMKWREIHVSGQGRPRRLIPLSYLTMHYKDGATHARGGMDTRPCLRSSVNHYSRL